MVARFGIAKHTLLVVILVFPLSFLKRRRSTLVQCKIINADNGKRGFSCDLIDCGNSTECLTLETYFASAVNTQTVTTEDIREKRNVGIPL